jgi:hypothetical protein
MRALTSSDLCEVSGGDMVWGGSNWGMGSGNISYGSGGSFVGSSGNYSIIGDRGGFDIYFEGNLAYSYR